MLITSKDVRKSHPQHLITRMIAVLPETAFGDINVAMIYCYSRLFKWIFHVSMEDCVRLACTAVQTSTQA
jgi:hypothetical protein